jgi:hypothetical protein
MAFNTTGMFRACAKEGGPREIGIWHWMIQKATNQTLKLFFSKKGGSLSAIAIWHWKCRKWKRNLKWFGANLGM